MAQAPENVTHGGSTTIDDNSSLATTLDESSTSPTISPFTINGDNHTSSILPTASPAINFDEICPNSPDWTNHYGYSCDDKRVQCHDFGSLGRAEQHCCKCRVMCCGRCNVTCVTPTLPPTVEYYNFKESKSSNSSSSWNFTPGPRYGALVIVVFFVSIIWCCNREQQSLRRTRRTMNHRRRRQQNVEQSEEISQERHEVFCSKFHFETVPSQDENSTASSKGNKRLPDDSDDDDSCGNMEVTNDLENTFRSVSSSTATGSYQPFASLKRTPARGECSICLDGYHAAEIVCIAINQACNHVYHQECIVEWLKTNDRCPLCRVDLMK